MKELHAESMDVEIGSAVNLKMDYRDVTHPRGVNGIVFGVSKKNPTSIHVVTIAGIITHGAEKKLYYIPSDRYKILAPDCVLPHKLEILRASVHNGDFDPSSQPRTTMQQANSQVYGQSPGGKLKCACKSRNCKGCKCSKAKTACTSACACNGSCKNPFNMNE